MSRPDERTGRRLLIEADGGSRGNPGPAGYGAVVRDADTGELLRELAGGIGRATNNVAEYRGLLAGLRAAAELAPSAVEVRMDSKLVVEQMSGRWRVRHPDMRALAVQAQAVVRALGTVRFRHVPRALNAHADRLANEAMDAAARGEVWRPPTQAGRAAEDADSPVGPPVERPPGREVPQVSLLLIRHAATALTEQRRFCGSSDPELTERGRAQAAALAARLAAEPAGAARVVSSPLRRARQTAAEVARALGVPVEVDPGLRESDFGEWEGRRPADVRTDAAPEYAAWLSSAEVAPPGGETLAATIRRVRRSLATLLADRGGVPVLVVSHLTPIAAAVATVLEAPDLAARRLHIDPTGITGVDAFADGRIVLRRLNDTAHLG